MNRNRFVAILFLLALSLGAAGDRALAQQPASQSNDANGSARSGDELQFSKLLAQARPKRRPFFSLMPEIRNLNLSGPTISIMTAASAANLQVFGNGTPGTMTKWTGFTSSNSTIGDSNVYEDKFGKVGIGTTAPTSLLTVHGMIETTLGGYKFPDGTVQATVGIPFVIHDATLMGDGRSATPLGIALGGVNTIHLANGAVTTPKIANGAVVRSLNGMFDNVSLAEGPNITIVQSGNTLTVASPSSLTSVAHDTSLTGSGTAASPLGVANGGVGNAQLAPNAVTSSKIASGNVVRSVNGLNDSVTLAEGSNITITKSGDTLTIAGAAGSSVAHHAVSTHLVDLSFSGEDVVSKQVPAGSYLIFFKIDLSNVDVDPQSVSCKLSTGDSSDIRLGALDDADKGMIVLQDAATFSATTTITVHCTGHKVIGFRFVLTALKVDSIE
ncbi:MAG TPA: hypothetical protein VGV87_09590 [Blastocatellia bacterium]|jgi:hypothetical protein|nr:hypothetical protein [Blastocatellia bacterium]